MRAFLRECGQPGNLEACITLLAGVIMVAIILIFAVAQGDAQANGPVPPVREQYPGHISGNDLRPGITSLQITTARGTKVQCIYSAGQSGSGGWPNGTSISCDWDGAR